MALLVLEQHVLAICMVGDAMGAILWVIPLSVSQAPMARAPTLPPITYGAVLAGTGTWRLIHVRHEVDKVVRVGVVVGVGLTELSMSIWCVLLSTVTRPLPGSAY